MNDPHQIAGFIILVAGAFPDYLLYRWVQARRRPIWIAMPFVADLEPPHLCPGCLSSAPNTSRGFTHKEVVYRHSMGVGATLVGTLIAGPSVLVQGLAQAINLPFSRSGWDERTRTARVVLPYCAKCKWTDLALLLLSRLFVFVSVAALLIGCGFLLSSLTSHPAAAPSAFLGLLVLGHVGLCGSLLLRDQLFVDLTAKGSDLRFSFRKQSYARPFREAVQRAVRGSPAARRS